MRKSWQKPSVLVRLSDFMSIKQSRVLMKSFTESQFGYCPLIWTFHGRGREVNNEINHLHEHLLCIVYKDNNSVYGNREGRVKTQQTEFLKIGQGEINIQILHSSSIIKMNLPDFYQIQIWKSNFVFMHVKETMRNFEKTFEKSKSEKNISSLLQKRCNRKRKID